MPKIGKVLLVDQHKKGNDGVCVEVFDLSTSEGRKAKTFKTTPIVVYPRMEVEASHFGLHV